MRKTGRARCPRPARSSSSARLGRNISRRRPAVAKRREDGTRTLQPALRDAALGLKIVLALVEVVEFALEPAEMGERLALQRGEVTPDGMLESRARSGIATPLCLAFGAQQAVVGYVVRLEEREKRPRRPYPRGESTCG